MCSLVTTVNNIVLCIWSLLRVDFKILLQKKLQLWDDGYVNQPDCGNHILVYAYKITTWHTLNLYHVICQLYLSKAVGCGGRTLIKISAFRDSLEQTLLSNLLTLIPNIVTQVVRSKSHWKPKSNQPHSRLTLDSQTLRKPSLSIQLEKEMATHSSILAWKMPGMDEPGG